MKTIYRKAIPLCLLFVVMFMIVGIAADSSVGDSEVREDAQLFENNMIQEKPSYKHDTVKNPINNVR